MILTTRLHRLANSIVPIVALAIAGCGESPDMRDQRLADFAREAMTEQREQNDRIADQSKAVVEESHKLAETAKELVKHDAQARQDLIAAQSEMTSQIHQQQSVVDAGRDELEQERRNIAVKRHRDPIIATAIHNAGLMVASLLPLVLCGLVIRLMQSQEPDHAAVADLLIQEMVSSKSKLISDSETQPQELEDDTDWMGRIPYDEKDEPTMNYEPTTMRGARLS